MILAILTLLTLIGLHWYYEPRIMKTKDNVYLFYTDHENPSRRKHITLWKRNILN